MLRIATSSHRIEIVLFMSRTPLGACPAPQHPPAFPDGTLVHIGAALLGHANLQTTRGYVAVFDEDVVRHYQMHLANRRAMRPDHEYARVTDAEWQEFEDHFD